MGSKSTTNVPPPTKQETELTRLNAELVKKQLAQIDQLAPFQQQLLTQASADLTRVLRYRLLWMLRSLQNNRRPLTSPNLKELHVSGRFKTNCFSFNWMNSAGAGGYTGAACQHQGRYRSRYYGRIGGHRYCHSARYWPDLR